MLTRVIKIVIVIVTFLEINIQIYIHWEVPTLGTVFVLRMIQSQVRRLYKYNFNRLIYTNMLDKLLHKVSGLRPSPTLSYSYAGMLRTTNLSFDVIIS